MKKIKWILLIFVILLTTSCWNYRELNDLSLVSAIGIDLDNDNYSISVQIFNAQKQSSGGSSSSGGNNQSAPVVVYEEKGPTIQEALNKIILKSPRELYLGHTDLVVISDVAARKGIIDFIDFLLRDREARKIFPVVIAKNSTAKEVVELLTPLEQFSAKNIESSLESIKAKNGTLSNRLFDEILACLFIDGREATITSIELIGSSKEGEESDNISSSKAKTEYEITGSAVFKKDKLVGYLNQEESYGYNFVRNTLEEAVLSFPCDDKGNNGALLIESAKTSLTTKIKNKKPTGNVKIDIKGSLSEFNCKLNLEKEKNITKIANMAEKELNKIINNSINKTQSELKSDIFGFGEYLYENDYKYWQKHKANWNDMFSEMPFKVKTTIDIRNLGTTMDATKRGWDL